MTDDWDETRRAEERGYMRGMLESILKGQEAIRVDMASDRAETKARLDGHSSRLGALERSKAWVLGVAAALGFGAGYIGKHS